MATGVGRRAAHRSGNSALMPHNPRAEPQTGERQNLHGTGGNPRQACRARVDRVPIGGETLRCFLTCGAHSRNSERPGDEGAANAGGAFDDSAQSPRTARSDRNAIASMCVFLQITYVHGQREWPSGVEGNSKGDTSSHARVKSSVPVQKHPMARYRFRSLTAPPTVNPQCLLSVHFLRHCRRHPTSTTPNRIPDFPRIRLAIACSAMPATTSWVQTQSGWLRPR